jgi:hypothetical protein
VRKLESGLLHQFYRPSEPGVSERAQRQNPPLGGMRDGPC